MRDTGGTRRRNLTGIHTMSQAPAAIEERRAEGPGHARHLARPKPAGTQDSNLEAPVLKTGWKRLVAHPSLLRRAVPHRRGCRPRR